MNGSHFLKTLGHTHSDWVFGTIAELVDNSRDAKATKLSVSLEYLKSVGEEIPMLSFVDDGCGMNHEEVLKMISFGPPKRKEYDTGHIEIGRFGISFKIGAMALGRDALVLTQTTKSRSLAFLSQTLNEGKIMLGTYLVEQSYERLSVTKWESWCLPSRFRLMLCSLWKRSLKL
ncbi:unnamed protein product [Cuscuta epithymum]|uniref:Uncharacterized protein n=1 Tax=Cuscuta epithymum TaxID=186058 RepID=A0AAV0DH96_9ASTE|nr:unnamed protein product [Cuscuta epithymum]